MEQHTTHERLLENSLPVWALTDSQDTWKVMDSNRRNGLHIWCCWTSSSSSQKHFHPTMLHCRLLRDEGLSKWSGWMSVLWEGDSLTQGNLIFKPLSIIHKTNVWAAPICWEKSWWATFTRPGGQPGGTRAVFSTLDWRMVEIQQK